MAQLYYETVEVGDPIPTLQKPPINRTQIARFAAASGDYGPLHVDEEVGRASGYGSVMAHGMIAMAYVGEMLEKWLSNGRVARLDVRFLKFIWPGDVLSAKGVVVPRPDSEGQAGIVCDVWVQNQNNDKVLQGKAYCVLFKNADDEKKHGGGKPPAVYVASEYVSPHKKVDLGRVTAGTADKPPPRPPPKAAGTPVKLSDEAVKLAPAAAEAKKGKPEAKAAKPEAKAPSKAEAKAAKPEAKAPSKAEAKAAKPEAKAPAKAEAKPAAKPAPAKPAAKTTPPKPAPAAKAPAKSTPPKPAAKAPAKPAPKAEAKPAKGKEKEKEKGGKKDKGGKDKGKGKGKR